MNNYTGPDSPWHRLCSIYLFRKNKKQMIENKNSKISEIKINDPFSPTNDSIYLSLNIHLCHYTDDKNQLIRYHCLVTSTISNHDKMGKNMISTRLLCIPFRPCWFKMNDAIVLVLRHVLPQRWFEYKYLLKNHKMSYTEMNSYETKCQPHLAKQSLEHTVWWWVLISNEIIFFLFLRILIN
jgi:hypothetical protein